MNEVAAGILKKHGVDAGKFRQVSGSASAFTGSVPGETALALWQSLREAYAATGLWPVIRGGDEHEFQGDCGNPAEILAQVPTGKIWALLADRLAERIESFKEFTDGIEDDMELKAFIAKVDASGAMSFGGKTKAPEPWPTTRDNPEELSVYSLSDIGRGKPRRTVRFAMIACAHPHEAPAHLGFGGWNDAPMPELQVAALREWGKSHGAVPIAVTGDVLECAVDRPPQTEAEAMELAAQQWIFCDDIVSQGTQTVRHLGIEIWRSPKWFFWWD